MSNTLTHTVGGQKCWEKNGVWTPIDTTALWTFVRDSSFLHAISFMFESRTRSYIISLRCLWLWWKHILLLVNRWGHLFTMFDFISVFISPLNETSKLVAPFTRYILPKYYRDGLKHQSLRKMYVFLCLFFSRLSYFPL